MNNKKFLEQIRHKVYFGELTRDQIEKEITQGEDDRHSDDDYSRQEDKNE